MKMLRGIGFFLVCLMVAMACQAHEAPSGFSYPMECCHEQDCGPAIKSQYVDDVVNGQVVRKWMITIFHKGANKEITGTVQDHNIAHARQSPDNQLHACILESGTILCLFVPPAG